jgi:O-antigen ligase
MEKSSLNIISIILIFYTIISLLVGSQYLYSDFNLSVSDARVQDAKNFCLLPMLFFLTLNGVKDKKWVWRTFWVMCASMFVMDYYTSSQVAWYSSLQSRSKITGTFQFLGPNEVAAFYDTCSIVMLGVYFFMKQSWKKMALLILVIFNIYCMMFMYSRAAYGATALGLFLLFAMKNKKLLIPLLLIIMFWQVALPEKARERIQGTKNEWGEYDESSARRFLIWHEATQIFQENPLAGIGFGSFRTLGLNLGDTHNIYIKIAAEQGVIGLCLFTILFLCFIREGYRLYKKGEDDESKGLGLGFMVGAFVVLANNMFGDRYTYYELGAYWWIYAGLVARLIAISSEAKAKPVETSQKKSTKLFARVPRSGPLKKPAALKRRWAS